MAKFFEYDNPEECDCISIECEHSKPEPLPLRTKWKICSRCRGNGKSSAHLGAITSEEWAHDWDDESREMYMSGGYDKPCTHCDNGKVEVVDLEWFEKAHPAEFKIYWERIEDNIAYAQMCDMERRMGA